MQKAYAIAYAFSSALSLRARYDKSRSRALAGGGGQPIISTVISNTAKSVGVTKMSVYSTFS